MRTFRGERLFGGNVSTLSGFWMLVIAIAYAVVSIGMR